MRGHMRAKPAIVAMGGLLFAAAGCNNALGVDEFSADGCPFEGARQCDDLMARECGEDGKWRDLGECSEKCENGRCSNQCSPGQRRCAGESPQRCDLGGQWAPPEKPCPANDCMGGVCGPDCIRGDLRCDGLQVEECGEEGKWHAGRVCVQGCASGICSECMPGQKECLNNTPRACTAAGQWENRTPCDKKHHCSDGMCEPN